MSVTERENPTVAARKPRGGEQQTLAIGRALTANPRALPTDEPSEGLAPRPVIVILKGGRVVVDASAGEITGGEVDLRQHLGIY